MVIRVALLLGLLVTGPTAQQIPVGKYLYVQPPPAIVVFEQDDIRLIPVKFPNGDPSRGIEVRPGVIVPYGNAHSLAKNKKSFNVLGHVVVRDGALFFDGARIDFNGLRIYEIREAYQWGEWVVCDGYSSASSDILEIPPDKREGLLPSELIYFRPEKHEGKARPFGTAPLSIDIIEQ